MSVIIWVKKHILYIIFTLLAIIIGILITWVVVVKTTSQASKDLNAVKSSVGRLMLLPTNEEPTLAIVQDKSKLTDKFLIDNAKNGDRVLIYSDNGFAIIYRPSINKIVAVSPVTINLAIAESSGATLTILNGTNDPNLLSVVENEVKNAYPALTITTGNANRNDLPTTIIIDNSKQKKELVTGIMSATNGQRGVVPLGETAASTDLMIIIGKDSL